MCVWVIVCVCVCVCVCVTAMPVFCRLTDASPPVLSLAVRSGLLADVLSEGGLLEHLLGELRRRAKILRKGGVAPAAPTGQGRSCHHLGSVSMNGLMGWPQFRAVAAGLSIKSLNEFIII